MRHGGRPVRPPTGGAGAAVSRWQAHLRILVSSAGGRLLGGTPGTVASKAGEGVVRGPYGQEPSCAHSGPPATRPCLLARPAGCTARRRRGSSSPLACAPRSRSDAATLGGPAARTVRINDWRWAVQCSACAPSTLRKQPCNTLPCSAAQAAAPCLTHSACNVFMP